MTFTSPVAFPAESTLELYGMANPAGSYTVKTVNGGTPQSVAGGAWQTITYVDGSESSFVITLQNNTINWWHRFEWYSYWRRSPC